MITICESAHECTATVCMHKAEHFELESCDCECVRGYMPKKPGGYKCLMGKKLKEYMLREHFEEYL